jgi:hypothetical protein
LVGFVDGVDVIELELFAGLLEEVYFVVDCKLSLRIGVEDGGSRIEKINKGLDGWVVLELRLRAIFKDDTLGMR